MCGIVGVVTREKSALSDLINGAQCLQHRGPEGAGLALFDDSYRRKILEKDSGQVESVFRDLVRRRRTLEDAADDGEDISGRIGISHTRYGTSGNGGPKEAHPFYDEYAGLALAYNGNIANVDQIKDELRSQGQQLLSGCDAEILLRVLSLWTEHYTQREPNLPRKEAVFKAIGEVQERVKGGFSAVLASRDGLYAFKDKKGFWNMVLGKRVENGNIVSRMIASETTVFEPLGYDIEEHVAHGTALYIDQNLSVDKRENTTAEPSPCGFDRIYLGDPGSVMGDEENRTYRWRAGLLLAEKIRHEHPDLCEKTDMVVAIPDSPVPAAEALAKELQLPLSNAITTPKTPPRIFLYGSQREREIATKLKFRLDRKAVKGKNVLLVDDSLVRGTNSQYVIGLMRRAQAKEIYLALEWPPIIESCREGIDTPQRETLLAAKYNGDVEAMREHLGIDRLIFNDIEPFREYVFKNQPACMACATGKHLIPFGYTGEVLPPRIIT